MNSIDFNYISLDLYTHPFMVFHVLLVCDKSKKLVFCIQYQNQASKPNRPHTILKAEVVSFDLISERADIVGLIKGYNCSNFGVGGGSLISISVYGWRNHILLCGANQ